MALSGCTALLKILVGLVTLFFLLSGIAILSLSVWMLVDKTFYLSVTHSETHYSVGLAILLTIGIVLIIVGFLGCGGACRESTCMLVAFFWLLLIILVAEIAAAAWAYSNRDVLEGMLRESVKNTVKEEYGVIESQTIAFDAIQKGLGCCGGTNYLDWEGSKYQQLAAGGDKMTEKNLVELTVGAVMTNFKIPPSCCVGKENTAACSLGMNVHFLGKVSGAIHSEGCIDKLIKLMEKYKTPVIIVGFIIGLTQILGLIFSLILCCAIHTSDHFKD